MDVGELSRRQAAELQPFIAILLYLCSQEPEIDDARQPNVGPIRPTPRKTQAGWRLFPADRPRVFDVGKQIGAKLRRAIESEEREARETGRTVRPHLRRAHYHGFWSGPHVGKRKFSLKWLPPTFVGSPVVEPETTRV